MLRSFLVGARVSAKPFRRPFKPYAQISVGVSTTKAPASTVHVSKFDYVLYGGVDTTLQKHVDFRVLEIGYGSLTTVSSADVGGGRYPLHPRVQPGQLQLRPGFSLLGPPVFRLRRPPGRPAGDPRAPPALRPRNLSAIKIC